MDSTDTAYLKNAYLPEPNAPRAGKALCLSGGGFRAALFHLGALRRLNELGILSQIDTISSVSGGSILAAHLADRVREWPAPGTSVPNWEDHVARPFRAFTRKDLRTGPVIRALLPWTWLKRGTAVRFLQDAYQRYLTQLTLTELPDRPKLVFCATDMQFGVNWIFEKHAVGDYQAGWLAPAPNWPVAQAVAASSCFPPVFNPMPMGLKTEQLTGGLASVPDRQKFVPRLSLTDGGLYDNMGLEPVWKTHDMVLVSNGGATFDVEAEWNPILRLLRYNTIQGNQAGAIRRRWLIAQYMHHELQGAYWGIGSKRMSFEQSGGYSKAIVEHTIATIRTDMDAFSPAEIAVLENHGYLVADAAATRWLDTLPTNKNAPLQIPHPQWMDEQLVAHALAESSTRNWFGRK